jgi:hypothetical protein
VDYDVNNGHVATMVPLPTVATLPSKGLIREKPGLPRPVDHNINVSSSITLYAPTCVNKES